MEHSFYGLLAQCRNPEHLDDKFLFFRPPLSSSFCSGWAIGDDAGDHRAKAKKWVHSLSRRCGLWDEYDLQGRRRRRRGKILVVVNPKAGRGQAAEVYRQLKRLLELGGLPHDCLVTERAGHAREFVRAAVFAGEDDDAHGHAGRSGCCYDEVVAVSGDGGIHEILNGLFDKRDGDGDGHGWLRVVRGVGLGVVPVGSGNALAHSLHHLQVGRRRFLRYTLPPLYYIVIKYSNKIY